MTRYDINYDKVVNQLAPHYLRGRKLILYLQSIVKPIQTLADQFKEWAQETRIEASMTSQVFKLEWFLNRRFGKYFLDASERFFIVNSEVSGETVWHEDANIETEMHLLLNDEPQEPTAILYHEGEIDDTAACSFIVTVPAPDTTKISEANYLAMIKYQIDKYKLANKTYKLIIS
jgi:hypothetical protein